MANQGVGGLYATVNLDISAAMAELAKLDKALKRAFTSTATTGRTGAGRGDRGGLDALSQAADKTTKSMRQQERATAKAGSTTRRFGRDAKRAAGDTSELGNALRGVGNNLSTTLASFGAARSGNYFYALSSGINGVTRGFGGATAGASFFTTAVIGVTAAVLAGTAAFAGYMLGLKKLTDVANKSGANLERLLVSFEVLLGTQQRAREELDFLIQAAEISPFFTEDIVALDRFLLAQGLLNDQLRRGLTQGLINFGAAAGLTGDRLRDLGYALGQVYNAGRLTGDEARQLRNNFLGAELVLRSLPRYAEMTGLEIKKAMETGAISSRDFFEALFVYFQDFGDAAAKQQQTLIGLKDTFIDVFQLGLGEANIRLAEFKRGLAPLENLRNVFRGLLSVFDGLDFKPLIASLGLLTQTFVQPFTVFLRDAGPQIRNFFEVTLPRSVLYFVNAFRAGMTVFFAVIRAVGLIFQSIGRAFGAVVGVVVDGSAKGSTALSLLGKAALIAASPFIVAFAAMAAAVNTVIAFVSALITLLSTGNLTAASRVAGAGLVESARLFTSAGAIIVDAWNSLDSLEAIQWDDLLPDFSELDQAADDVGGAMAEAFPPQGTGDAAGKAASATKKDIDRAMNTLYELSQRWFGLRSELERGLLGDKGFEATVSSIASMGERVIKALKSIEGTENAVAVVQASTLELIKLARRREEVAEALAAAERNLEEAIKARDAFADRVRDSALKFANAFQTEEETVRKFQQFSERGFFYETEEKKQRSFVESLRERLSAMKNFLANIKRLRSLGLNANLLEEMLAAGPEQAGAVAAELANGGKAIVDEVNVLQDGVTRVADELGQFGAKEFYQAGVDIARAQLNGLLAEMASIEAAAIELGRSIFDAIQPWAVEMEELGASAGGGLASGLSDSLSGIDDILAGFGGSVGSLGGLSDLFADLPGTWGEGLLSGTGEMQARVDEFFGNLQEGLTGWYDGIELSGWGAGVETALAWLGGLWSQHIAGPVVQWWETNVGNPVRAWWEKMKGESGTAGEGLWNAFVEGMRASFGLVIKFLVTRFQLTHNVIQWGADVGVGIWQGLWDGILNVTENMANLIVGAIEQFVRLVIVGLNALISAANSIPGVNLSHLNEDFSLPRFDFDSGTESVRSSTRVPGGGIRPSDISSAASLLPEFDVSVFIGDRELTEIVDTQVTARDSTYSRTLVGARRV